MTENCDSDIGSHKKYTENQIKEIVNDVHPLDDRPKDRFSNTEQAKQFLIDYYRSARGRVAKDRLMDSCFQAGQERHKHSGAFCDECANIMKDDTWYLKSDEALVVESQTRKMIIDRVLYQAEKLNTLELKEKAPMCWTKLQQFIEFLEVIKNKEV
jgi:hypothetical protein